MIDFDGLSSSVSSDSPCGENLEYHDDFINLIALVQLDSESIVGDELSSSQKQNFDHITMKSIEILGRSKDIRIAVILANASLKVGGLPEFEKALKYIKVCLEDYWDCVHPQLDAEDNDDPTMRINAVLGLVDYHTVLKPLKSASLLSSFSNSKVNLNDLTDSKNSAEEGSNNTNGLKAQSPVYSPHLLDPDSTSIVFDTCGTILQHIADISDVFYQRIGDLGPDLDPLRKAILELRAKAGEFTTTPILESVEENASTGSVAKIAQSGREILSRKDVISAIDCVVKYYVEYEPTSPLPILLNRARRLVTANFIEIVRDLGAEELERIKTQHETDP